MDFGDYTVERDDLVYLENWTPGVFRVSMTLPDGRLVVSAEPATEPGVRGEVGAREVWPAATVWHGTRTLRGEVVMASPLRGRQGRVVVLAKVGDEFATGLMTDRDWGADRPEWEAGHWFREWDQAVRNLRHRAGWPAV
ncbi:hypothetical protein [Micromonospora sp. NPDC005652]|uniref:hypothetical protein n=1 Tax=Micromonospora sp. NPDC005652 TaxID=3157046 RepID=UPI0033CFD4F9